MTQSLVFKQLNPHACWTYLVGLEGSNEVVLVDPVLDHLKDYLELLDRQKLDLVLTVDTHTHADHISAGPSLKDQTGCDYAMHQNAPSMCAQYRMDEGFTWHIGDVPVKVMYTPGHTQDGMTLIFPDRLLTGDTLFLDDGGAGRDDLPGGDPGQHWDSLQRISTLPDHLVVYPAHEYRNRQASSLGQQKKINPHLKPRSKEEFVTYLEELRLGPADWMKDVLQANYTCARDPNAAWIPVDVPACEVKGTMDIGANEQVVSTITARELKSRLDAGDEPLILDVRESQELYNDMGYIEGIKHIPIGDLTQKLDELKPLKEAEIVVACKKGGRSYTAAQILGQAGFDKVYVLDQGMEGWKQAGYPLVKERSLN